MCRPCPDPPLLTPPRRVHHGSRPFPTVRTSPLLIYKITPEVPWRAAERAGQFAGAAVDLADGFIHFSTATQARETAARHFAGQAGLLLVTVEADALGPALRWEPSRGGELFPHLYAPLPMAAVREVSALPLDADGHRFPKGF